MKTDGLKISPSGVWPRGSSSPCGVKIHALQTGTVRIKESQRVGRGVGPLRVLHVLFDSTWTQPLPILAWAIETDDGVIVVDTGETAKSRLPGYFPARHPYFRRAVRVVVEPEEEIGLRLREVGLRPQDVRLVLLTHLHTDHAGGLHHFRHSQIYVSGDEFRLARGWAGRVRGYLPHRWPDWFAPVPISWQPRRVGPFDRSCPITRDGSVTIVPTPGHTPGHVSVVVRDEDVSYFLAGDASYTQQALVERQVDGVSPCGAAAQQTLDKILAYAKQTPTVYLPSHDPASVERLNSTEVMFSDLKE